WESGGGTRSCALMLAEPEERVHDRRHGSFFGAAASADVTPSSTAIPAPGTGPSPQLFFETANAFQRSQALKAAVELELFTVIGEGKQSSEEIAAGCNGTSRFRPLQGWFTPLQRLAMLLQGRSPFSCDCTLSALITASLTPSVIGDRPSHAICLQQLS